MGCSLFAGEDDFGVEEGAGYAGGDGEEVGLSGEDFDVAGAGDVGEVDGAAVADAGGGGFVGGDGRKLREELAGVDEEGRDCMGVDRVGIGDAEVAAYGWCGGRDSSTRARMRSHSLRMTGV